MLYNSGECILERKKNVSIFLALWRRVGYLCVYLFMLFSVSPSFRSCDKLIQVLENGAANNNEVVSSVLKEQTTWVKVRLIRIMSAFAIYPVGMILTLHYCFWYYRKLYKNWKKVHQRRKGDFLCKSVT